MLILLSYVYIKYFHFTESDNFTNITHTKIVALPESYPSSSYALFGPTIEKANNCIWASPAVARILKHQKAKSMTSRNTFFYRRSLIIGSLLLIGLLPSIAQDKFPSRPVKIMVGSEAGSAPDLLTRILANELSPLLGQSVIVENRSGATGTISATQVASSTADGYTLMTGSVANVALAPLFYPIKYDPVKSFTPIGMVASVPLVLVTSPAFDTPNFQQFATKTKQKTLQLAYASPGIGGPQHLAAVMLQRILGRPVLHVPYKSGGAATNAVMAGEVQFAFVGIPVAASLAASNKLVPLFVTSEIRSAGMPRVPSATEVGLKDFQIDNWHALLAPAGLPANTRSTIEAALQKALASPLLKEQFNKLGAEPSTGSSKQLELLISSETARWANFVKENNLKAE
jgi:tripartite-type tricarboxylate transporter receptor subunit TctC